MAVVLSQNFFAVCQTWSERIGPFFTLQRVLISLHYPDQWPRWNSNIERPDLIGLLSSCNIGSGEEWCYKMIGKIREAGNRRRIIWTESGIDTRPLHASGFYYERSAQYLSDAKSCCLLLRGGGEAELKPWPLLKSERHGACHQIHLLPARASHPSIL